MISNQATDAVWNLDLGPIKAKLMHMESGEGWSQQRADMVEVEYKRFLHLMKTYPNAELAPSVDTDIFWHYHILDTMKYAVDCETVFGYFLHHYPYVGMGGEDDEEVRLQSGDRMRELYEQTFKVPYLRLAAKGAAVQAIGAAGVTTYCASPATPAYCASPSKPASLSSINAAYCASPATPAYCASPSKPASLSSNNTAYCASPATPAYCASPSKPASLSSNNTAYCASPATPAYCASPSKPIRLSANDAAYCASPATSAYCASPSKPIRLSANNTAYCAAPATPAYCASPSKPVSIQVKSTAYCAAPSKPAYCASPAAPGVLKHVERLLLAA